MENTSRAKTTNLEQRHETTQVEGMKHMTESLKKNRLH